MVYTSGTFQGNLSFNLFKIKESFHQSNMKIVHQEFSVLFYLLIKS